MEIVNEYRSEWMTKLSVIWCNFCSFLLNARSNIKIIYYSKTSHCKTRLSVYCKQFNDRYRPSSQYTFLVYLKYVHCAQREMFIFFASNQLLAFAFNCRYHGNPCVIAPDVKTLIPSYFCFFKLFLLVSIHIALNNGLNPKMSIFPLPLPSLFCTLLSFVFFSSSPFMYVASHQYSEHSVQEIWKHILFCCLLFIGSAIACEHWCG